MNFETRQALVDSYINTILENMSTSDLMEIAGGYFEEQFASYSDEELVAEVEEYYPELLEV